MNVLLLMMGGSGTRLGAAIPKQFLKVEGKPIFQYILEAYSTLPEIGAICIVSHQEWISYVEEVVGEVSVACPVRVTAGGESRSESVRNGLQAIRDLVVDTDIVLLHDATHPYMDAEGTRQVIRAAAEHGGATLGACQYDTCYQMDEENLLEKVIPRQLIVSGASPEGFRYGEISHIYFSATKEELDRMTSAGAIALAHGVPMEVIPSNILNLKITYPQDLALFRLLVHTYFFPEE